MAARVLPTWPLILFGVLEPIALVMGAYTIYQDPKQYITDQVPSAFTLTVPAGAIAIVSQLGNVFLLLAGLAILCCFTSHASIARGYLLVLALADVGHIYATYLGLGEKAFTDWQSWNQMVWANIGSSAFLCVNRWATLAGIFGPVSPQGKAKRT